MVFRQKHSVGEEMFWEHLVCQCSISLFSTLQLTESCNSDVTLGVILNVNVQDVINYSQSFSDVAVFLDLLQLSAQFLGAMLRHLINMGCLFVKERKLTVIALVGMGH